MMSSGDELLQILFIEKSVHFYFSLKDISTRYIVFDWQLVFFYQHLEYLLAYNISALSPAGSLRIKLFLIVDNLITCIVIYFLGGFAAYRC